MCPTTFATMSLTRICLQASAVLAVGAATYWWYNKEVVVEDPLIKKVMAENSLPLIAEQYLEELTPLGLAIGQKLGSTPISRLTKGLVKVEVEKARIVSTQNKPKYIRCVLDQVKVKFGTPTMSEANIKAVTRYAERIMVSHGVRPTHIAQCISYVVHLTFIPSEDEMRTKACISSGYFKALNAGKFDDAWHRTAKTLKKYLS